MKKQTLKILVISFVMVVVGTVKAGSINEISIIESAKASCSANKKLYKKCFGMSESDCKDLLTTVIPECSQNKVGFSNNPSALIKFGACLSEKLNAKLTSKGIGLDESCLK